MSESAISVVIKNGKSGDLTAEVQGSPSHITTYAIILLRVTMNIRRVKMQTIQLKIEDDNIADKILSILKVFKDGGVLVEKISTNSITKDTFKTEMDNAFSELKNGKGKHTSRFIKLEV